MDAVTTVVETLSVPRKYVRETSTKDRAIAVVHHSWLKQLIKSHQVPEFVHHDSLTGEEVEVWVYQGEKLGPLWEEVIIKVLAKENKKVIPLPRARAVSNKTEPPLSYTQLLHYVSQTNHKNLWKEAFKKYLSGSIIHDGKSTPTINFVNCDIVMRDIISRTYGCPVIRIGSTPIETSTPDGKTKSYEAHSNVLPAVCAVETDKSFLLIHQPHLSHTLQDCVTFSPALLGTSHMKPMFIIYQLLQIMRSMHDRGLVLGDISLRDVLITENLWIQVMPRLEDNIHDKPKTDSSRISECKIKGQSKGPGAIYCTHCKTEFSVRSAELESRNPRICGTCKVTDPHIFSHSADLLVHRPQHHQSNSSKLMENGSQEACDNEQQAERKSGDCDLKVLCEMWIRGQLSNFDYLSALNRLAGRRYGDPTCHYVMPWVTDFTFRSGGNWRDLSRSKYRLNKGDRQLDLTYETATVITQIPHHVSDVLSEITYYVYLARRTPRSVLCKYVRPQWVPAEYPSSIQRLQVWTPDECIPEFFTDPSVFKSIHEDLPDLELPPWASCAEDFIEKHREALESVHITERLHHWIDLTFGYKLSGSAAVKAKNVCLQLVDSHMTLTNTGVVQLFTHPHPQRHMPSPYCSKAPPKLHLPPRDRKKMAERVSEDEGHSSGFEEEDGGGYTQSQFRSSPLALSRFLSRSRGSLLASFPASVEDISLRDRSTDQQKVAGTLTGSGSCSPVIVLPKDYNPVAALQAVESLHNFVAKTFYHSPSSPITPSEGLDTGSSPMQVVAGRRIREMQVLGCLVVELFLAGKLRPLGGAVPQSFNQRLEACHSVLAHSRDYLPRCVKYAVSLLLQVDMSAGDLEEELGSLDAPKGAHPFRYPTVTSQGLPPPSAHQLLQPLLSSAVFPFPAHFLNMYTLLETLHDYSSIIKELSYACFLDPEENIYSDSELSCTKSMLLNKIAECKVKTAAKELSSLLPELVLSSPETLELILPYIKQLLQDPHTSVLTAWHLFDPISKVLGPQRTSECLLQSFVKLYGNGTDDSGTTPLDSVNKHVKLYHRSFLLQLIVRLGLRTFLDSFIAPLVEAVGGYRDFSQSESSTNCNRPELTMKSSHLKSCELEELTHEVEGVLSPLDENSSGDSEQNKQSQEVEYDEDEDKEKPEDETDAEVEPEVFVLETDDSNKYSPSVEADVPIYRFMDDLDLNLSQSEAEEGCSLEHQGQVEKEAPVPKLEEECTNVEGIELVLSQAAEDSPTRTGESRSPGSRHKGVGGGSFDVERSKSEEDLEVFTSCIDEQFKCQEEEKIKKLSSQCKVSDMSADSVIWLSHRLGPVLTARHLSRNLLRMLTLCYLGKENLSALPYNDEELKNAKDIQIISISNHRVIGDQNAAKVLECLASIAALYGEQCILLQYLPHMSELIALCKKKMTANLEGGLVGCLSLLTHIVPYLRDSTLMDQLQDVILKNILHPAVRLVSTTRFVFPSGTVARNTVAAKFLDALYIIALRIGCEMTREHLTVPSLQRFFMTFDKAFGRPADVISTSKTPDSIKGSPFKSAEDSTYVEVRRDGTTAEWAMRGIPMQISYMRVRDTDSADSFSPPHLTGLEGDNPQDLLRQRAMEELKGVFTYQLAHHAYLPFVMFLGDSVMEQSLKNEEFIRELCFKYEQEMQQAYSSGGSLDVPYLSDYLSPSGPIDLEKGGTGSFGSNVAVVGNRIDLQRPDIPSLQPVPVSVSGTSNLHAPNGDVMALINKKMDNSNRHLHGNWLAYWEHEIGRSEKDSRFNFKQIKLQTFSGHTNSVRAVHVLDNENSFISGSRDKTVKLWSLRSQGDGSTVSQCQWTYPNHRKSVVAITFLESLRLVASCDYGIHLWDPFMGSVVGTLDSPRYPQVNVLKAMPAPSTILLAATTDIVTLRLVDGRNCSFVNELKVSMNPAGYIRCIAMGPAGNWVALGQSSGFLTILDIRTGCVVASWKGHEGEVLQLVAPNNTMVISSSLDQSVSVWSAIDGKLIFQMKGPTEPVHCLSSYGCELISGTTANRIGVHTAVDSQAAFSSTRLRSDTFKGVLTTMAVLPLNRLLLLGADNGNISLLC